MRTLLWANAIGECFFFFKPGAIKRASRFSICSTDVTNIKGCAFSSRTEQEETKDQR